MCLTKMFKCKKRQMLINNYWHIMSNDELNAPNRCIIKLHTIHYEVHSKKLLKSVCFQKLHCLLMSILR